MDTRDRPNARKSLPMSERDRRDLEVMRRSMAHRVALSEMADVDVAEDMSDAGLLHAVLEAGLRAVERQVEADGYAQIASELDTSRRRAAARRRRPSWADE